MLVKEQVAHLGHNIAARVHIGTMRGPFFA